MSLGGDIMEEYYEQNIIPQYKEKIKELEGLILSFYQKLKGCSIPQLAQEYEKDFSIVVERQGILDAANKQTLTQAEIEKCLYEVFLKRKEPDLKITNNNSSFYCEATNADRKVVTGIGGTKTILEEFNKVGYTPVIIYNGVQLTNEQVILFREILSKYA